MAWKTRKQRGGSLARLFGAKKPLSQTQRNSSMNVALGNNLHSYGRKGSEANFISLKKKKSMVAKMVRNHVTKLKSLSNTVRNDSLRLMNETSREKAKALLTFPKFNSLSNDQVVELYTTGKVRSASA